MGKTEADRARRDSLLSAIDRGRLDRHVRTLCQWDRLTGETGAERAVDFIIEKLSEYGIAHKRHRLEMYCSDPIHGEVRVQAPEAYTLHAKARSFCKHCPDGIIGEVVYDRYSKGEPLSPREEEEWLRQLTDKVVLSWNYYEDYVQKLEQVGAKGLIHIWPTPEAFIHEDTVGPIWGTPTPEKAHTLPKIPVIGLTHQDGTRLLEQVEEQSVTVLVKTEVRTGIKTVSLPVATIPGETDEYILLSGHYDSWHMGATDNAVGNALCLEVAKVFAPYAGQLKRGIKIAWWPGHSNARYAGSAWYCDHHWLDLNKNCVAHINVDFPGTQGGVKMVPRSTGMEDREFLRDIYVEITGEEPRKWAFPPRGADQSFWGVDIPIHLGIKYEPLEGTPICSPGCAGGWWWHTEEDLYDKVDLDLLYRDTKLHVALIHALAESKCLPIRVLRFLEKGKQLLWEMDRHSDEEFNFGPILQAFDALIEKWQKHKERLSLQQDAFDRLLKTLGGSLNRLMFSYSSPYDYDNTFPFGPFPGLHQVKYTYRNNTPPETFLFRKTYFVRQRNRVVQEIRTLIERLENT
ncbi:hypothetical protein GCM10011571_11610 [Marinithermofilum abyssi]|uniref:Peptidase M28 domain-containing protein n=1 Tax=Marinithermofilum abyssi TaxID=1571185 RepID=A0A8J2Y8Z1_9BACL|nr:M28 family peptidase [Marinithermofilum abyssi]GGE11929.1 hypothetical protein GCM10011571_11610 [Marinithermofilum abyssi]